MKEFTLKSREDDWLRLNIGEHSYKIPLATSITLKEARSLETMDGAIDFFRKYMDEEVADALSLYDYRDIIQAWKEASEKAGAPGESQASRDS